MRGRLPTPANLDAIRGNPSNRPRTNTIAAQPAAGTKASVTPPKGMSTPARRVWRRLIAPAIADGRIDPVLDQAVCAIFCASTAETAMLGRMARRDPNDVALLDAATLRLMRARDRAATQVMKAADQLGLSPLSRLRLGHPATATPKMSAEDIRARLRQ